MPSDDPEALPADRIVARFEQEVRDLLQALQAHVSAARAALTRMLGAPAYGPRAAQSTWHSPTRRLK